MKIGLVGLPLTGKTTFFNLLTQMGEGTADSSHGRNEARIGTAKVPDRRIDYFSEVYHPKKTTYAVIEVIDIQGILPSGSAGKGSSAYHFLESIRQVDALVHVVRAFRDDSVVHTDGSIDPLRDIETINMELLFADLAVIENRIQRIQSGKKITRENQQELELLDRCRACLEGEQLLSSMEWSDEDKQFLKTFNFLTERPMILLINVDEEQYKTGEYDKKDQVSAYAAKGNIPLVTVCAQTELEISQLEDDDRALFMEDMGIEETGLSRLAAAAYDHLGLISFLTVGEDEVRAWTIKRNTTAKAAGGKIHSDIARGFIRAEVAKYSDYEAYGSMQKLKEKGLVRLEGKEAIIEDGDIINFRFNV